MQVFDFGANWKSFSERRVDIERLNNASQSLQSLLQREKLQYTSFLDVGCGSGLFSIAAHKLQASNVVGIDINPRCITVSEKNRDQLAPQSAISFLQMSVLDSNQMSTLGHFDIVYAWGSLHHTGAMWETIRTVAQNVAPDGIFVLAIYNQHVTSPMWKIIKRFYNYTPKLVQYVMSTIFAGVIYIAKFLVTRSNPLNKERGMDFWYDVIDWIGGYPYEYANPHEIDDFMKLQGFVLRHFVPAQVPTGCNEFVFRRLETGFC